jgi:hypothetical protein
MDLMDDTEPFLSLALADLARTMPDDPRRLAKVRERARRARRRRTVAQGTVVTATVGGLALGLVATRPGSSGGTANPATGAAAATASGPSAPADAAAPAVPATEEPENPIPEGTLPDCSAVPPPSEDDKPPVEAGSEEDAAKAAAAGVVPAEGAASHAATDGATDGKDADPFPSGLDPASSAVDGVFSGGGMVTGPSDGSTLTLVVKGATFEFAVVDTTRFLSGGVDVDRPALAEGAKVAFTASVVDGPPYPLAQLELLPAEDPAQAAEDAAVGRVRGKGTVQGAVAAPASGTSVVVAVGAGSLEGQTVSLVVGPDTVWQVGKVPCLPGELADGTALGFTALPNGEDGYVLEFGELAPG